MMAAPTQGVSINEWWYVVNGDQGVASIEVGMCSEGGRSKGNEYVKWYVCRRDVGLCAEH